MTFLGNLGDERLESLPFPFKNSAKLRSADPKEMLNLDLIGKGFNGNNSRVTRPSSNYALRSIGQVKMIASRTTPCISVAEESQYITMAMLYAGDSYRYDKGNSVQYIEPGSIHVCQRTGGIARIGYFSGIICEIDKLRLDRTAKAIGGEAIKWNRQKSYVLKHGRSNVADSNQQHLWALFSFIDQLLGESEYLAAGLGLDEQIYRLLALSLFNEEGSLETIQERWRVGTKNWTDPLDELVDYIRENYSLNLTLTDLEEQSHYSGRHLQNLFKEKFDCSPMQFVRRQRLSIAMEKLQTASREDTVTRIARDIGYHYTSNFCNDFHREFGVTPSVVLRSSRG